ncbi:hypothetical protein [Pseudooceanicola nanhaiensis]|uniref:hypothetical protein n=1 Tax=Pseudooceanicola nanhaiensis TaxID=375761 RepID=UPI001CD4C0A6|nr:hypothetical protein [Pseudooceanicola nanhaiensis]MCA0922750.1 hypothetical protein [Pseudooceanicola nanhaiensis]
MSPKPVTPGRTARLLYLVEPAAPVFLLLNVVFILAYALGATETWPPLASLPATIAVLLLWGRLSATAHRVVMLSLLAVALGTTFLDPHLAAQARALHQACSFVALMTVLGTFKRVLTPLDKVVEAFGFVMSQPPRLRFGLVQYMGHFFALLINLSVIPLFGALSGRKGQADQPANHDAVVLGAMRGATMVALWSPFSIGFAVVSQSIPTLDPVRFMLEAGLFSSAVLWVSARFHLLPAPLATPRPPERSHFHRPSGRERTAVLQLGGLAAAMLCLLVTMHEFTGVAFSALSILTVCVAIAAVLLTAGRAALAGDKPVEVIRSGTTEMINEATVVSAAAVIGAELSVLLNQSGLLDAMLGQELPVTITLVGMVMLAGLIALAWIPTSVVVVTLAQMVGNTPLGQENPQAFALTLGMCWIVSVLLSPVSGMSVVTARVCGVSTSDIIFRWNRSFTTLVVLTGCAFIWLIATMTT